MRARLIAPLALAACGRAAESPITPERPPAPTAHIAEAPPAALRAPSASPPARPAPCDPALLTRARQTALARARESAFTTAQLEGCDEASVQCEGPALDDEPGACRIRVGEESDRLDVSIRPPPRDGARVRFDVWLERDASRSGNVFGGMTSWAASADGALLLRGSTTHAIHEHGGAPAHIGSVRLVAYNRSAKALPVDVREARFHVSVGEPVKLEGLRLAPERDLAQTRVVVPAHGMLPLQLSFEPRPAYQASGQRFWVETTLTFGDAVLRPVAEIQVSRIEPLRR